MRLVRFFDKLNTPVVVAFVLVLALIVNGFLLFRQPESSTGGAASFGTVATKTEAVESEDPTTTLDSTVAEAPESSEGSTTASDSAALEEPEDEEPAPAPEIAVPEDLGEFIRGCDGDRKECAREFVAEAAPEARYIGGRNDLNAGGPGRNREILYFEDPTLDACEHVRQESAINDGLSYVVILVGQGSFDSERGSECIPGA